MRPARTPACRVAALAAVPATGESRLAAVWRKLINELFEPYRPELHYMRGRGPKWRAKHGATNSP